MPESTRADVPDSGSRAGRRRRRALGAVAVAALVAGGLAVAGCGGSDDDSGAAASTTAPATTAPATTAPATTAPPTTAPASTAAAPVAAGDAAAGKVVFSNTCAGCHAGLGTRAGVGPQLAAQGLTAAFITTTLENGRGQMPAGLVSGQDLADVVAYVESLQ